MPGCSLRSQLSFLWCGDRGVTSVCVTWECSLEGDCGHCSADRAEINFGRRSQEARVNSTLSCSSTTTSSLFLSYPFLVFEDAFVQPQGCHQAQHPRSRAVRLRKGRLRRGNPPRRKRERSRTLPPLRRRRQYAHQPHPPKIQRSRLESLARSLVRPPRPEPIPVSEPPSRQGPHLQTPQRPLPRQHLPRRRIRRGHRPPVPHLVRSRPRSRPHLPPDLRHVRRLRSDQRRRGRQSQPRCRRREVRRPRR